MESIEDLSDERNKAWCIHCAQGLAYVGANRDHVPSRVLLRKPYPENLPVVSICKTCNTSFSLDEEYFAAFLGAVLAGSTDPDSQCLETAKRILSRTPALRMAIDQARVVQGDLFGEATTHWMPDLDRITRVVIKNARGHAYFEYGEPMLTTPSHVWFGPIETMDATWREKFENVAGRLSAFPEVGSRMLSRVFSGADLVNGWVVVQENAYRYCVSQQGGMIVRTIVHEYLATEVIWQDD